MEDQTAEKRGGEKRELVRRWRSLGMKKRGEKKRR